MTSPTLWRCACDFKVLLKFKMADMVKLQNFLWAQKTKKIMSEIIQILQSHCSVPYGNMRVGFKVATTTFKIFVTAKTLISLVSHCIYSNKHPGCL